MLNKQNPISLQNRDQESRQVKKDLIKVLVLNGTLFVLLVALYLWNRSTGLVDRLLGHVLKL